MARLLGRGRGGDVWLTPRGSRAARWARRSAPRAQWSVAVIPLNCVPRNYWEPSGPGLEWKGEASEAPGRWSRVSKLMTDLNPDRNGTEGAHTLVWWGEPPPLNFLFPRRGAASIFLRAGRDCNVRIAVSPPSQINSYCQGNIWLAFCLHSAHLGSPRIQTRLLQLQGWEQTTVAPTEPPKLAAFSPAWGLKFSPGGSRHLRFAF